jgi:hypothetical protein
MAPSRFPLSVFSSGVKSNFSLLGREPIPCPHPEPTRVLDIAAPSAFSRATNPASAAWRNIAAAAASS